MKLNLIIIMSLTAVALFVMLYWAYRSDVKLKKWRDSLQPGTWVNHTTFGAVRIEGTPAGNWFAVTDFDNKKYIADVRNIYPL